MNSMPFLLNFAGISLINFRINNPLQMPPWINYIQILILGNLEFLTKNDYNWDLNALRTKTI